MITRLSKPVRSALLSSVLCFSTVAFAQDAANSSPKSTKTSMTAGDEHPDLFEIDPFGGISLYGQLNRGLTMHTSDGGVGGLRLTYNPTPHWGLEAWADYAGANIRFLGSRSASTPNYSFGAHDWIFGFNPVFNIRPRGSRVQPYVTAGVMGARYTPSVDAIFNSNTPAQSVYNAGTLRPNVQAGFNFGGGVKFHLTDHFGLRFDIRDLITRNPTFGLPNAPNITPGVYIPSNDRYNGVQATMGVVLYGGSVKCPPMPPAPAQPAPLPTPVISGGTGTICQGKPVTLNATMSGVDASRKLSFAWTVNGQPSGSNSPDFTFTPSGATSYSIGLTVTDTTPLPAPLERPKKFPERCWTQPAALTPVAPVSAAALTLTTGDTTPTISSVTASPTALSCVANTGAHTSALSAVASPAACGGSLTYNWTVSEGSLTGGTTSSASFDASSLNFEAGSQAQSKTVTATVVVTDASGKSATQSTSVSVKCEPTFVRLDDVIYAKNNARVNNCGKRLLIDDAASRMQSGDYDIILVAHRDTDEAESTGGTKARKGRKAVEATPLDEQRALNAAAVLSGGTGTCGKVDMSRIKIDWVGTDQTSETRPGQCGTSATKATERKGSEVSDADKNRRVEVYLVPHGSSVLPPAVKAPKPLSDATMKALACPK